MDSSVVIYADGEKNHELATVSAGDGGLLFRADDIGKVLGLTKIHNSLVKFGDELKQMRSVHTRGGPQRIVFLTEMGVCRVVMASRKSCALPFQDWILHKIVSYRADVRAEVERMRRADAQDASREAGVRDGLADAVGGETEFATPVGRADVVSATEVIEVKAWRNWKHAMGQVLAYAKYMPDRKRRIHLFGEARDAEAVRAAIPAILAVCSDYDVAVTVDIADAAVLEASMPDRVVHAMNDI